jgi:hypothetical protein
MSFPQVSVSSPVRKLHCLTCFPVDAHTAHHLYTECLKGELMRGRTVILVSHHVQLCAPAAAYVVALDNGRIQFSGSGEDFVGSDVMQTLVQSKAVQVEDADDTECFADEKELGEQSETTSTVAGIMPADGKQQDEKKGPRQLVEDETRAVGRVERRIWWTYITAVGELQYWLIFGLAHVAGALAPVVENSWLRYDFSLVIGVLVVEIAATATGQGHRANTTRPTVPPITLESTPL